MIEQTTGGGMMTAIIGAAGFIIFAIVGMGLIMARLYRRASKEVSFVRTGMGGQKVVKDGGATVIPLFQESIDVNMRTLRLEVKRGREDALITKNRMRVDVSAEFYVRVRPDLEAIATAAQTLGNRTMDPGQLKELVEGKFVDALRAVAAEMTMEELHEKRTDFVQKVQESVSSDLSKNGLELESVSLTGLDQTSMTFFNADNAFDAEGLTVLTRQVQAKKKERNDIEQETKVSIQEKNLDAERQSLDIARESQYANLDQAQEVETRRAQTEAAIKAEQEARRRESEEAEIQASRNIKVAREAAEKDTEAARVARDRDVNLARQEAQIAVAEKSKEESAAKAEADSKRAEAVKAEESVTTAREESIATRAKIVRLIKAAEDAEEEAIGITVAAEAEKQAATDRAESIRIDAQGRSDAVMREAEANEKRLAVEAEGVRLLNEARNLLSDTQIDLELRLELVKQLPAIIEQQMKPLAAIDGIKIVDARGLTGNGGNTTSGGGGGGQSGLSHEIVDAAMRYRAQSPLLDGLLGDLGITDSSDIGKSLGNLIQAPPADVKEDAVDADDDTDADAVVEEDTTHD